MLIEGFNRDKGFTGKFEYCFTWDNPHPDDMKRIRKGGKNVYVR